VVNEVSAGRKQNEGHGAWRLNYVYGGLTDQTIEL
jgi:hypothetical protein